jgi:hypothetical protein
VAPALLNPERRVAQGSLAGKSLSKSVSDAETGVKSDWMQSAGARRERAVLTNRPAGKSLAWSLVRVGAAIGLSAAALTSAHAGGVGALSCVGGYRSLNCVARWGFPGDPYIRAVPEVLGEAEKAQAATRERRWLIHCHPIVQHDPYGVARYVYAAPGCEYGAGGE